MAQAIACCKEALAEDPDYAEAVAWQGISEAAFYEFDFDLNRMHAGLALMERAIRMDPTDSRPFVGQSLYLGMVSGPDASRAAIDHALRLNPGDYYAQAQRAQIAIYDGDHDLARRWIDSVNRLTPNPLPWITQYESLVAFHEGRFREACTGLAPFADQAWQMMYMIAALGHLGERDKAQAIVARFVTQGRVHDYLAAAEREPYLHHEPRNRLIAGLHLALD